MALINFKTDLKTLSFGKDTPGGGNSNQPYIKSELPLSNRYNSEVPRINPPDFILRGGISNIERSHIDTLRMSKWLIDPKSLKGTFFTLKTNLLSRSSVRTETSDSAFNQGIYNPTNTILQSGLISSGIRLPLFKNENTYIQLVNPHKEKHTNRLVKIHELLHDDKAGSIQKGVTVNDGFLLDYTNGPGSLLGVGRTQIRFAKDSVRSSLKILKDDGFENKGYGIFKYSISKVNFSNTLGVSNKYNTLMGKNILPIDNNSLITLNQNSVYTQGNTFPEMNREVAGNNNTNYWTQDEIVENISFSKGGVINNFLKENSKNRYWERGKWEWKNRKDIRYSMGDPGDQRINKPNNKIPLDIINSLKPGEDPDDVKDLVDFKIRVIGGRVLRFRSFIDTLEESTNASWNSTKYVGRGENFYHYEGFDENVTLAFTTYAQSLGEMKGMYEKLNYLKSILIPSYSKVGFMKGNIISLTIGNYFKNQPGILRSLSYRIVDDTTGWDIEEKVPFGIKVTNVSFTPIHNFLPSLGSRYIYHSGLDDLKTPEIINQI